MKNRMTIEELRTLELPVTLECDNEHWLRDHLIVKVLEVTQTRVIIEDRAGFPTWIKFDDLKHYPSQKSEPRTVVFRQWIDTDLRRQDLLVSSRGYRYSGSKHTRFKDFLKWVGEEHHIEVPNDWRGEE